MQFDIVHVGVPLSNGLKEAAERHVKDAIRGFQDRVEHIGVRVEQENEASELRKQCRLTIELASAPSRFDVVGRGADEYEAVRSACARLAQNAAVREQ
jgi:sugar phosphate isomerase/epimerase